jgi:hypothetical protein
MEITITTEDLSMVDSGGGHRRLLAEIHIDSNLPRRQQRQALLYETLGALLSYSISHENLLDIAIVLGDALDQWEQSS